MRALPWLARFSLSAGGLGYARFAPGTWGSLPACVMWAALMKSGWPDWVAMACLGLLFLWACVACVRFGGAAEQAVGMKDPNCVVADEVAGMCIALVGVHAWWGIGVAFVLFRIFDVIKPPPCTQIQNVKGGWGILLDDLCAGVYALIVMHLIGAVVKFG